MAKLRPRCICLLGTVFLGKYYETFSTTISYDDNVLRRLFIIINMFVKTVLLFLFLLFNSSNQDCLNNETRGDIIPFILPIYTEELNCYGIIISRYYILTNAKCVNGAAEISVQLRSRRNSSNENIGVLSPENIIIHENFKKIHSSYYRNDLALLKLPSPLNFSLVLKPARFLANGDNNESLLGKTVALVVWKAGHLTTTLGVIQKSQYCSRAFGQDFNPLYHFCILISDDISVIHIDGSISHPVLVNANVIGFAVPYPIVDINGRLYRIMRLPSIINWVKNYTNINKYEESIEDIHEDVEDCLFQNIDSYSVRNNSLTFDSILNQLIQKQLKDIKTEVKTAVDSIHLKVKENIQTPDKFQSVLNNLIAEQDRKLNKISQDCLVIAKDYIDNKIKGITNEVEDKYKRIQRLLLEKGEDITKNLNDKGVEIDRLLNDKAKELSAMITRLSELEQSIKSRID